MVSFVLLVLYVLGHFQDVHGIQVKAHAPSPIYAVRKAVYKDEAIRAPIKSTRLFINAGIIDNFNPSSFIRSAGPILFSAFCAAAIMYPMDLIRALQMANAGSGEKLGTLQLLDNFRKIHGFQGFFTQGLVPELARSTW